ncbi:MAG: hypothetical protein A2070_15075 [Bdellovibrionales bacterium GWC1_52_8]|nr:MAG: hypothetical protein A2Z97_15070 [Bdellovibrionales bacterium GWB1_52_6]OFZ03424.1 MAG: hypothetical protein A2X97_05615 [Bdellovibrionales bacterium GWA1_52_35]OFZ37795.1 MAG: hypothetical protein A2070_15075 [Bdellovibrionales bacterium GWC1_52_8]
MVPPDLPTLKPPVLNWRELALLISKMAPLATGLFVEKLIVPERKYFPAEFIKGEWFLRLSGKRTEGGVLFSVRARHPYVAWVPGKGPKASARATHSVFDLSLSKYLRGVKIQSVEVIERERVCSFWFGKVEASSEGSQLGLVLILIPAAPEALLVQAEVLPDGRRKPGWQILARSRQLKPEALGLYFVPDGVGAPVHPPVRPELSEATHPLESWTGVIEAGLKAEAFLDRLRLAHKTLSENTAQLSDRIRQSEAAVSQANAEPDWQAYGDLLKVHLPEPPALNSSNVRVLIDYATETPREIPCDPKLNPQQQVAKFYQNAKRKTRRIEEAQSRIQRFTQMKEGYLRALASPPDTENWEGLEQLERIATQGTIPVAEKQSSTGKKKEFWAGRNFVSKDGVQILVGRSRAENLELTFKVARGNDLWLHLRGRPGAHVLIQLQPGKSAPLETLLDAANLVVHYSGGEDWGKTEVDYTFKKYVKRIKDSTEASYTHNKTLMIEPDRNRIKRLLESEDG